MLCSSNSSQTEPGVNPTVSRFFVCRCHWTIPASLVVCLPYNEGELCLKASIWCLCDFILHLLDFILNKEIASEPTAALTTFALPFKSIVLSENVWFHREASLKWRHRCWVTCYEGLVFRGLISQACNSSISTFSFNKHGNGLEWSWSYLSD